jgi:hypothetical protein
MLSPPGTAGEVFQHVLTWLLACAQASMEYVDPEGLCSLAPSKWRGWLCLLGARLHNLDDNNLIYTSPGAAREQCLAYHLTWR